MAKIEGGGWATFNWQVTIPAGETGKAWPLTATFNYAQGSNSDERIVRAVPAPPPPGTVAVSDLPFVSATNGWGPVERDTSVGEQAAGDGKPITLQGVTFAKGLGTNSVSDVQLYLGGHCSRFTATVGVDDEQGNGGSVTFSVIADGVTKVTTARLTGLRRPTRRSTSRSPARSCSTWWSATAATATARTTATGRSRR